MKLIRLALLVAGLNFTCLLGQDCRLGMLNYAVPTSWEAIPDDNPMTVITVIGCLQETQTAILVLKTFVNNVPKEVVAVPKGSVIKMSMLQTVDNTDKLQSDSPKVVKNVRPHLPR